MARKKTNKKKISFIIGLIVFIVFSVSGYFYGDVFGKKSDVYLPMNSDFTMTAYFIDVGQGDSSLFVNNGHSVLIDSGEAEYADLVKKKCETLSVEKLDCVIVTHPHSDHAGGMAKIIRDVGTDNIIIPDIDPGYITSSFYADFLDAAAESEADIYYAQTGDSYTYGDMTFSIVSPEETGKNLNNDSIVTLVTYENVSILMTGDAQKGAEKQIIKNFPSLKCDVLKVGHHGSSTSTSKQFLDLINPKDAVISVGEGNRYSHPSDETVNELHSRGINIYRTDLDGDVILRTNGNQYKIETERGS